MPKTRSIASFWGWLYCISLGTLTTLAQALNSSACPIKPGNQIAWQTVERWDSCWWSDAIESRSDHVANVDVPMGARECVDAPWHGCKVHLRKAFRDLWKEIRILETFPVALCNLCISLLLDSLLVESFLQSKHPGFFLNRAQCGLIGLLLENIWSTSLHDIESGPCTFSSTFFSVVFSSLSLSLSLSFSFSLSFADSFSFFFFCFSSNSSLTRSISASISFFFLAAIAASSMIGLQNPLSFRCAGQT